VSKLAAVLIIEDEPHARMLLQVTLGHAGYYCLHAATARAGLNAIEEHEPNLVILDLGLPDFDGVEVTRRIRERSAVPIIVVSARDQEVSKIAALDGGANDYVTKPFAPGELLPRVREESLARVRVAMRHAAPTEVAPATGATTIGDLSVDFDRRLVTFLGAPVKLTPIEYRLLGAMVRSAGRVLTHREILRQVWGPQYANQVNYLRVYMKKLRYKIEPEPARPRYLLNELGVGYRFRAPG
jgi:two-component system KDP operon response regulator KdpE